MLPSTGGLRHIHRHTSKPAIPGAAEETGDMRYVLVAAVAVLAMLFGQPGDAEPRGRQGDGARQCLRQAVRAKMFKELEKMTDHMVKSLPKDDIKHRKLLPKFGKSMEKPWGISVLKEILRFYSEEVFSKESLKTEIANNDVQLLISSLETHVDYCLVLHPGALHPKERTEIEEMKGTFTELKELGVYKAVGEFKTVLDWIETYIHTKTGNWKSRGGRSQ